MLVLPPDASVAPHPDAVTDPRARRVVVPGAASGSDQPTRCHEVVDACLAEVVPAVRR